MTPIYDFAQLKARINAGIKGKIGILVDSRATINEVAREVLSDFDLRSTRRSTPLTPNLFDWIFEYFCPTDLKDYKIISVDPQTDRKRKFLTLVPTEQFHRRQDIDTVAVSDEDFVRKLLIAKRILTDKRITLSTLDSLTAGGGTWVAFGGATNLRADTDNFVRGNGSLRWDISADVDTTAGVQNTGLNLTDITEYLGGNGALFVWVYINSVANLTNFIFRLGSSSGNYLTKTITTQNDGTAFRAGWNLLRFDLTNLTTVGSPVVTAINFAAIFMTKDVAKVSETDYRFDDLILRKGENQNVRYYSKYPWQSISGAYKENSTVDSDLLNCDTTEFELFVSKGIRLAGYEADEYDSADRHEKKYDAALQKYKLANPSEALNMIVDYQDFISS